MLQNWGAQTFSKVEASRGEELARVLSNFACLISNFSLGNKATNLEISLASYKISLSVFSRDRHPEIWATIQNDLGHVHQDLSLIHI